MSFFKRGVGDSNSGLVTAFYSLVTAFIYIKHCCHPCCHPDFLIFSLFSNLVTAIYKYLVKRKNKK